MKKILVIGIFLTLVIPAIAISAPAIETNETNQNINMKTNVGMLGYTSDDPLVVDLIADGGSEETAFIVGEVHAWDDGTWLYVKYVIGDDYTADWDIYETHVHIGETLDDFPLTKKGSPKIGQFDYQMEHDPPVDEYTYTIPYAGEDLVAAHAVVKTICGYEVNLLEFEENLPDQVTFSVTYPYGGGPAYFPHTYINGLAENQIDVYSWCVDTDNVIYQNTVYTANIYSSYETIPAGLIEFPENLDLVNWILNQGYVGQASPGCDGTYTYGDVQRAIWELVEDTPSTSGLGAWSQCRVNEILAAANANGEGYTPGCGDIMGVILAPVDQYGNTVQVIIAQVTIAEIEIPCDTIYCDETAWGEGTEFIPEGKDWSMYFYYDNQCNNNPVSREFQFSILQRILERFPNAFPILRYILGL